MEVKVVGTNIPLQLLKKLPPQELLKATPEVISAAYARISRSTKDVNYLLTEAINDVEKARKSNERIIYGMGHHSIADHVIFNINISKVSRLVVESIEARRLAGYTEKSQRYVKLGGSYIQPKEFDKKDLAEFSSVVELGNHFYAKALKKLPPNDIHSKEDARYSLSLATETQLGCSYTGETAELAIRKLKYGELIEEREFAHKLYTEIEKIAPSIIQLTDPKLFKEHNPGKELVDDFFKYTEKQLKKLVPYMLKEEKIKPTPILSEDGVSLLSHNSPDLQILTCLLHNYSTHPLPRCVSSAQTLLSTGRALDFVKSTLQHLTKFDKPPRPFEVGYFLFELILSASAFAQLKRHRMNTLLPQEYNPELGYTIPPKIEEIGFQKELKEVCDKASELCSKFKRKYQKASLYCLTNAHRRRVLLGVNVRQLYHIIRIREDKNAQWEIREKASIMKKFAQKVAPITTLLMSGEDKFEKVKQQMYQQEDEIL
jgi:thymidylate synthase ThyX